MFAKSTKTLIGVAAIAIVLLATPSPANAGAADLSTARAATAGFHQVEAAKAAGYGEFRDAANIACIETPGVGVMGIHYGNGALVTDGVRAHQTANPFRRRDDADIFDPLRSPLLQDVDGRGRRSTRREHRVEHEADLDGRG